MKGIRRKEQEIKEYYELAEILSRAKYITIAMCSNDEPYLVSLSHGFDPEKKIIYFHSAQEGKKTAILKANPVVWGQALRDHGYVVGKCDHLYSTVHFRGTVTFINDIDEKRKALLIMISQLETDPQRVMKKQITQKSLVRVNIGRIDITHMSGKRSKDLM